MAVNMWKNARDVVAFEAGQVVFEKGDVGDVMYAIVEGAVDIERNGEVIESLVDGDIFGELALVDDSPRNASAVVTKPSRLARVDQKQFTFLVHEHPTFALTVMHVLADRLRRANDRA